MAKRSDWRVVYSYPGARRLDPDLDIEWVDTSCPLKGTMVRNSREVAEADACGIVGRGGQAELVYVHPETRVRTRVAVFPPNTTTPELDGGDGS